MSVAYWLDTVKRKLLPQKGRVGCDVGASCIKVVKLEQKGGGIQLCGHGLLPCQWDAESGEGGGDIVPAYLESREMDAARVAVNLGVADVMVSTMELARMPSQDTEMAIRWSLRGDVEGDIEALQVAYSHVEDVSEGSKQRVAAFAVTNEVVERRRDYVLSLGLNPVWMEPSVSALLAAMDHNLYWNTGEFLALLDIGYEHSVLLIAADGALHACEILDSSLRSLSQVIAPAADDAQREQSLLALLTGEFSESDLAALEEPLGKFKIDLLVNVQRALDGFVVERKLEMHEGVQRLFMSGGGAMLPDIMPYMMKNLGIGVDMFNPFRQITNELGQPVQIAAPALYSVAVGLALPV